MKISRCDYIWSLIDNVILIEDLNLGGMSVTNDAENVITEIYQKIGEAIKGSPILYKDSEGVWDGISPEWGLNSCTDANFYHIGETNSEEAIKKVTTK